MLSQTGDLCPVGIVGLRRPTGFGLEGGQLQPLAPGPVVTGLDEGPVLAHVLRAQLPVPLQVFGRYCHYLRQVFLLVTARQLFQLREDTGQKPGNHLPPDVPTLRRPNASRPGAFPPPAATSLSHRLRRQ